MTHCARSATKYPPLPSSHIPLKHSVQEEKESLGKVGRLMENNNRADHGGGRRRGAELVDRIAAFIQHLDSLEALLIQAIKYADRPAYTARATIMRIYIVLKIIQLLVVLKMGRQDIDPRFQLTTALIAAALGCVRCGLLMYIMLGDMPWLIFVLCVLMPFTFMAN